MITKEQILQAEGEELSRLLGEVLQPEKNKHILGYGNLEANCRKCNELIKVSRASGSSLAVNWRFVKGVDRICTIPDPIPLTWPEAMKWRDWAHKIEWSHHRNGLDMFNNALKSVCHEVSPISNPCYHLSHYAWWLANKAQPKHYEQAAAYCKLNQESKK